MGDNVIFLIIVIILIVILSEYKKRSYLILNGNIIYRNLNSNYNLESLMRDLIKNKINDIDNIEKAYLSFGFLKIKLNKPHILVVNGKIDYEELFKSRKTVSFIYNILKEKSLKLSEVLYAIYLNDKFYVVKM